MITTKPNPIVGVDEPPIPPQDLIFSRARHPLPTRDIAQPLKTDMITGRSRGLQFQNTYLYNSNALITTAGTYTLWIPATPTVRTRIKKLYVYISAGSALAGGGVLLIELLDNGVQTGFVLPQFLPNAAATTIFSTHSEDFGAEGYVTDQPGNTLSILTNLTITGSVGPGMIVVAAGNDEIDYGPSK